MPDLQSELEGAESLVESWRECMKRINELEQSGMAIREQLDCAELVQLDHELRGHERCFIGTLTGLVDTLRSDKSIIARPFESVKRIVSLEAENARLRRTIDFMRDPKLGYCDNYVQREKSKQSEAEREKRTDYYDGNPDPYEPY